MEDVSKLLMMSAAILLAIMILALGTRLFRSALGVVRSYDSAMETAATTEFNTRFAKFLDAGVGENTATTTKRESATIYDIISLANFAYEYNTKMVEDPKNTTREIDPVVVEINIANSAGTIIIGHLQNHSEIYHELMKKCYYENETNPNAAYIYTFKIIRIENNNAGRVNFVTFQADQNMDMILQSMAIPY